MASNYIAVIPAYEPDEKLLSLLEEAYTAFAKVIIVDDGSGSEYASIFATAAQKAHLISYESNRGKGYAMKTAFRYIKNQYGDEDATVVVMDCDGQHTVKDALRLCEKADKHHGALVLGSRKQSKASPLRSRLGNAITRFVFRITSKQSVYDTQTGLRAFHMERIDDMLSIDGERYEYEMNVLMQFARRHIHLLEIPIETIYIDNNSGSHFDTLKDSFRIYKEIAKFSCSSFIAFLIDYTVFTLLVMLWGDAAVLVAAANILARLISATANFFITRHFVFRNHSSIGQAAIKYAILALCILICNTAVLHVLTAWCHIDPRIAKIPTELIAFFFNWLIQRTLVFRKRTN